MRRPLFVVCLVFLVASLASAKEVFLSIAGTVSNFHTDARIFNPSASKDITLKAYFLPAGLGNNSAVQPVDVTVPKRSMKLLDDVVTAIFSTSGLGAIRLTCNDDFVVTSRIYAQTASGTLGQFVPGLDGTSAKKTGVLIQIKSTGSAFRTNIGAVNPGGTTANVTWRLYDKNNGLVGGSKTEVFPPYGVLGPQNVSSYFGTGSADLSDAWVSYTSDQPLFAYISVLDNATTDPTFISGSEDSGASTPPTPQGKLLDVTLRFGQIVITPAPDSLASGDTVTFRIHSEDVTHGFQVNTPTGTLLTGGTYGPSDGTVDRTVTIPRNGTYSYFCTVTTCSSLHGNMFGSFIVGQPSDPSGPGYKK
jgi:plastocyanin